MSDSAIRPARISQVLPESIAAEVGFEVGDSLVAINGQPLRDLIDYQFLCADEYIELEVLDAEGKPHTVEIEKECDEDLGLEFESAFFDGLIQCNNRCPFCFIDQQPPGKRESLYLKDDDYRLSFLYGSYLTLTNLSDREWNRIERMRLSPLYVSVHATEPEIRTRLLKNPRAGKILDQLQWFQERGLQIHAQVVLCPGINDGEHLAQTIRDLARFHRGDIPTVASVAIVPVGLTRFRPDLNEVIPVTTEKAREIIDRVQAFQAQFQCEFGSTFVWLADEWFLIARRELPPAEHYESYPQIDNGVGSIRLFLTQFEGAARSLPAQISPPRRLTWVVGNTVEQAFQGILETLNRVNGLTVEMAALHSEYWGQTMTVTGLLTGSDIVRALKGKDLGDGLLVPTLMLKHGTTQFLDDMTLEQVSAILHCPIYQVGGGPGDLIQTCLHAIPVAAS
ncbi:TIGR03279 family radical SAM protein [Altericista sp. CCNU0014]|uniref:TIGR03279 family radical SAM protein n=1 Tax=Altericista sp. CCNU0014 TaxID=3082949 RepID=UPI00384CDAD2